MVLIAMPDPLRSLAWTRGPYDTCTSRGVSNSRRPHLIGGVGDPVVWRVMGGTPAQGAPHDRDPRELHRVARCRAPYDRCHPGRGAARNAAQSVHAVDGRQPPDHRDRRRRARGRLRCRRPVGDHRAAAATCSAARDGAALGPGPAARPATDDLAEPSSASTVRSFPWSSSSSCTSASSRAARSSRARPSTSSSRSDAASASAVRGDRRRDRDRGLPLDPRGGQVGQRALGARLHYLGIQLLNRSRPGRGPRGNTVRAADVPAGHVAGRRPGNWPSARTSPTTRATCRAPPRRGPSSGGPGRHVAGLAVVDDLRRAGRRHRRFGLHR